MRERAFLPVALAWSLFYGLTLLYIPGAYLVQSFRRGRLTLKWFLLLPLVAAAPLLAVVIDPPSWFTQDLKSGMVLALITLPVLLAITRLVSWSVRKCWRPVVIWLAATVIASVALAAVALLVAQSNDEVALVEGEHYASEGWWFIWFHGAYLAALLLVLWYAFTAGIRRVVAWARRPEHTKGAVPT